MTREEVIREAAEMFGAVPGWISGIPDPQLEHQWELLKWVLSDSQLTVREKALVAFGAATAVHCPY